MITIPAYLFILVLSTLLAVIVIQRQSKARIEERLIVHAITWELLKGESTALKIMETYRTLYGAEPSWGRFYSLLHFLVRSGAIARRVGEIAPERGNRPRIYYRLTDEKRKAA
jgi:DNA-binding PadR family transcriptional regulator